MIFAVLPRDFAKNSEKTAPGSPGASKNQVSSLIPGVFLDPRGCTISFSINRLVAPRVAVSEKSAPSKAYLKGVMEGVMEVLARR